MTVITRTQYMAPSSGQTPNTPTEPKQIHHEYYSQFVTPKTIAYLSRIFTTDELAEAMKAGEHFNAIPLDQWDALSWESVSDESASNGCRHCAPLRRRANHISGRFVAVLPFDRAAVTEAGETVTRAVLVCIAKAAARIIVDTATAADNFAPVA